MKMLAELIRKSKNCVAYTGAGAPAFFGRCIAVSFLLYFRVFDGCFGGVLSSGFAIPGLCFIRCFKLLLVLVEDLLGTICFLALSLVGVPTQKDKGKRGRPVFLGKLKG